MEQPAYDARPAARQPTLPAPVILGAGMVTLETVHRVAHGRAPVRLHPDAHAAIAASHATFLKFQRGSESVYGLMTGVGALLDCTVPVERRSELQHNIVRSHAAGVGDELSEAAVRAIVFQMTNSLARGLSGVRPALLERLLLFLNRGVHPVVPSQGSVGSSGDLVPHAHVGLPLIGEGTVRFRGRRLSAREMLRELGLHALQLEGREGLALVNGTHATAALGALACREALRLMRAADMISGMTLDAAGASRQPFHSLHGRAKPSWAQDESRRMVRAMTSESEIGTLPGPLQDSYALRCVPQVHGAVREALGFSVATVERELNAVTDNPLVFAAEEQILSGGAFHGEGLAFALDFAAMGLAELAAISERRLDWLLTGKRGLPRFLAADPGVQSGMMIPQYTVAAILTETRILAAPAVLHSIPLSAGQEDHVSMAGQSVRKLGTVVTNVEQILAIELLAAAQALDFRRPRQGGQGTRAAHALLRRHLPHQADDQPLQPALEHALALLRSSAFDDLHDQLTAS